MSGKHKRLIKWNSFGDCSGRRSRRRWK